MSTPVLAGLGIRFALDREGLGMRWQGFIFDVDGTLVDSNDAHAQAWVEALAEAARQAGEKAAESTNGWPAGGRS